MSIFTKDVPELISIPSATLRKFAGSRVDPYTRFVAYVLFRDLNTSVRGQRNINNALSNLPVHLSVASDGGLSFGWGLSSLIRDRVVHEGSYEHLAMMVALGESFHEHYAAKVLKAMATTVAEPQDVTPHFSQWKAALHACNGVFASTDFGLLVEDYIRVDPWPMSNDAECAFPPDLIAEGLQALMRVTGGHEKQVTFTGNAILSWFGAVAEWLCGLRVAVYQADGKELHSTHSGQEPQMIIVFVRETVMKFSFEAFEQKEFNLEELSIVDQTYSSALQPSLFGGRVEWQSLLPRVFGTSFHHLVHEESKAFGLMIGSGARMFEDFALGRGEHSDLVSRQNQSNTASYGAGLVETITNWFPELRRFQGRMERPLKLSYEDAAASYGDQLSKIRKACHCGICTSKDQEGVPTSRGHCLAVLVETIISLGLALSRITVEARLYPTRSGIQTFYLYQVRRRVEARGRDWIQHFRLVYGNVWNAPDATRLQNSVQIFAGSRPTKELPANLVALSHEGACAYFADLEKSIKSEKEQQVRLIRVVPGSINVNEKVFDRACMGPVEDADPDDPWEQREYEHLPEPLFFK